MESNKFTIDSRAGFLTASVIVGVLVATFGIVGYIGLIQGSRIPSVKAPLPSAADASSSPFRILP